VRESQVYCDLCGKKIPDRELEDSELEQGFRLDLGILGPETELDMWKELCRDCAEDIHEDLQGYEWKF